MIRLATRYKLRARQKKYELDLARFQQSLPPGFVVEEKDDGLYVAVPSARAEDQSTQYLIDRELDRLFFLTGVRMRAEMIRRQVLATLTLRSSTQFELPSEVGPQRWSYELALQLHLWAVADELTDPIAKILLFYQVIELAYPERSSFPKYTDATLAPAPLTECRLLRHLVAHAGEATHPELKAYCEHLGLPPLMLDRLDPGHVGAIAARLPLLESEARKVLASAV